MGKAVGTKVVVGFAPSAAGVVDPGERFDFLEVAVIG
jgi:hypothetical protein